MNYEEYCVKINPMERITEILDVISNSGNKYVLHENTESDEYYSYMQEESLDFIIVVNNPYDAKLVMAIDVGEEMTLYFAGNHCHYSNCEGEFKELITDLKDILESKCGVAVMYKGKDKDWCASRSIDVAERDLPIQQIFDFIFEIKETAEKLRKEGGEARIVFWNPQLGKTVTVV